MGVASQLHPIVVGVVLALAAQALFARRNLARHPELSGLRRALAHHLEELR